MTFDRNSATRRQFLRVLAAAPVSMAIPSLLGTSAAATSVSMRGGPAALGPDEALQILLEGNRRFVLAKERAGGRTVERRFELTEGQSPFATILSCSDSRVPPEIVFDAGLGDLFVCRVAGNIDTPEIMGSIEYAVGALGSPLIVVLGHSGCGAVSAALAVTSGTAGFEGYLAGLVDQITPAAASIAGQPGNPLANAVRANVQMTVSELLRRDPDLAARVGDGQLGVVGGVYDLASGQVELVQVHWIG